MSTAHPYRFAVLSHTIFDERANSSFMSDGEFTLDFFKISYDQPLFGVSNLLEQGYETILFYSSFGPNILQEISNALVLIPKTDMDIIRALLKARKISQEIILPVHANENTDTHLLEKLLDIRIFSIHYNNIETLQLKLKALFDQGKQVVVGGGISETMSAFNNISFFRVMPNSQSIKQAIKQAKGLVKARREELHRKNQLIAMLKLFQEGVICVDETGGIIFYNDKACELLAINRKLKDKNPFEAYFQQLLITDVLKDGSPRENVIISVGSGQLVISSLPIFQNLGVNGAVVFIRDVNTIRTLSGRLRESRRLTSFIAHHTLDNFKGSSPAITRLKKMVSLYAPHSAAVFIHGETGTGKEVIAQALHNASPRRDEPFVAINCAALPETLLESELFGYEEGAFTGAKKGGKPGVFEMAHKGSLFLDEVGDMEASAQQRLLRVLETRELVRVGGSQLIPINIRVISASNRPLLELVNQGKFRRDLFYRLAVLRLYIPPLRKRLADIPLLISNLLMQYKTSTKKITPAMWQTMEEYKWPGNVRELTSFFESYLILLGTREHDESLFFDLLKDWAYDEQKELSSLKSSTKLNLTLKEAEEIARRKVALNAVHECGGNKRCAASLLGISYNTLWRILNN